MKSSDGNGSHNGFKHFADQSSMNQDFIFSAIFTSSHDWKLGKFFLSSFETFIGQKSQEHVDVIVCFVNISKCLVNAEYSTP